MNANYDPWSTHIPALALAVHKYGSRVLEIGAGWYSTPLLNAMSKTVTTVETDGDWAKKFSKLNHAGMLVVPDIMKCVKGLSEQPWDVVFIDCEGNHFRIWIAELFLSRKCCVVAHDTQEPHWLPIIEKTKHVRHFDFIMPRTSHLSNILDVT